MKAKKINVFFPHPEISFLGISTPGVLDFSGIPFPRIAHSEKILKLFPDNWFCGICFYFEVTRVPKNSVKFQKYTDPKSCMSFLCRNF